jgi:hypothetical protein
MPSISVSTKHLGTPDGQKFLLCVYLTSKHLISEKFFGCCEDFEKQTRSSNISLLLINTYNNYYIVYCSKSMLKECDMEKNCEAAQSVNTAYFK